jgi:hypothetical protein
MVHELRCSAGLSAVLAWLVIGCGGHSALGLDAGPDADWPQTGCPDAAVTPRCLEAQDWETCRAEGGCWDWNWSDHGYWCVCRANDAWKPCTRATECEGMCLMDRWVNCGDADSEGHCSDTAEKLEPEGDDCVCYLDENGVPRGPDRCQGVGQCSDGEVTPDCQNTPRTAGREACLAEGGCWALDGMGSGGPSCRCPAKDAGNPCTTALDCEGQCVVGWGVDIVNHHCDELAGSTGTCTYFQDGTAGCICFLQEDGATMGWCDD